jgi:hypothetical protein
MTSQTSLLLIWDLVYLVDSYWKYAFQLSFEIKTFVEILSFLILLGLIIPEIVSLTTSSPQRLQEQYDVNASNGKSPKILLSFIIL